NASAKLFVCTDATPPVMSAMIRIDSVVFDDAACDTVFDTGCAYSADISEPPVRPAAWMVYMVMPFAFAVFATDWISVVPSNVSVSSIVEPPDQPFSRDI